MKAVEVTCPKCRKIRRVRASSHAAEVVRNAKDATRRSSSMLHCKTCKLKKSIADHYVAIDNLQHQVRARTTRGL